jgi:hypothetical protein
VIHAYTLLLVIATCLDVEGQHEANAVMPRSYEALLRRRQVVKFIRITWNTYVYFPETQVSAQIFSILTANAL